MEKTFIQISGIIEFSSPLFCAKDSLGQSIDISIANNDAIFSLPSLPEWVENEPDPLHKPLVPPMNAKNWKEGKKPIYWGSPDYYPTGESSVRKAFLECNIPSKIAQDVCQDIYQGFHEWLKLFENYVLLLTTQNTRCIIEGGEGPGSLILYDSTESQLKPISKERPKPLIITHYDCDESLHLEQLIEACRLASLKLAPRPEYSILLEAYNARRNADFRKAIIEAATALEICLTSHISEEFKKRGITFGEKLLKKFRMLGGRFELIRLLDILLPDKDYETLILNPRNDVVHQPIMPEKRIADQVITEVEQLLRAFSPGFSQDAP